MPELEALRRLVAMRRGAQKHRRTGVNNFMPLPILELTRMGNPWKMSRQRFCAV